MGVIIPKRWFAVVWAVSVFRVLQTICVVVMVVVVVVPDVAVF
jgi:hypothetical protein